MRGAREVAVGVGRDVRVVALGVERDARVILSSRRRCRDARVEGDDVGRGGVRHSSARVAVALSW